MPRLRRCGEPSEGPISASWTPISEPLANSELARGTSNFRKAPFHRLSRFESRLETRLALFSELRLAQPSVSKHLKVLLEVGLVRMRREGRQVLYRTDAEALRPLHEWASRFERYWWSQVGRLKERAEQRERRTNENPEKRSKR